MNSVAKIKKQFRSFVLHLKKLNLSWKPKDIAKFLIQSEKPPSSTKFVEAEMVKTTKSSKNLRCTQTKDRVKFFIFYFHTPIDREFHDGQ